MHPTSADVMPKKIRITEKKTKNSSKCPWLRTPVFKKHVSFWLVTRVPEAIFLWLVLVLLMAWLSLPLMENLQSLVAKARLARGKSSSQKGGKPTSLRTPGNLPQQQSSRVECRPPMSKKRPTTRGGPNHAPRLRPDQCMLCRQVGHRASECPNKGKATAFSPGKRAFGTHALGSAVFNSQCYATVEEIEQDQDEEDVEDFVVFSI